MSQPSLFWARAGLFWARHANFGDPVGSASLGAIFGHAVPIRIPRGLGQLRADLLVVVPIRGHPGIRGHLSRFVGTGSQFLAPAVMLWAKAPLVPILGCPCPLDFSMG